MANIQRIYYICETQPNSSWPKTTICSSLSSARAAQASLPAHYGRLLAQKNAQRVGRGGGEWETLVDDRMRQDGS